MPIAESSGAIHRADLIFVYAGREDRKLYGLQLYAEGRAPELLLSVGRFEIRRFGELPLPEPVDLRAIAAPVEPPLRHFFVSLSEQGRSVERIRMSRFGTLAETQALCNWLNHRPEVRRILIVSSRAHRLRVELCCKKLLPATVHFHFVPVPKEISDSTAQRQPRQQESARYFLSEFGKLLLYRLVLLWRRFIARGAK